MTIGNFVLDLREMYEGVDDRIEKSYKQEFQEYPEYKLDKILEAVKQYHEFGKAPELGKVFRYMDMAGISRSKNKGVYWARCKTCNTNYSIDSYVCPRCNKNLDFGVVEHHEYEIINGVDYPNDLKKVRTLCSICPIYRGATTKPKGIDCQSWGREHDNKAGLDCKNCKCFTCCIDYPKKDHSHDVGAYFDYIRKEFLGRVKK